MTLQLHVFIVSASQLSTLQKKVSSSGWSEDELPSLALSRFLRARNKNVNVFEEQSTQTILKAVQT